MDIIKATLGKIWKKEENEVEAEVSNLAVDVLPRKPNFATKLAFVLILATIFLLPIIFIPSVSVHFLFTKQVLFVTAILFAFAVWLFTRLKEGVYEFPKTPIVYAGFGVVAVSLLSALFSGSVSVSMFGQGFEVGTFMSLFAGFLAVFVLPVYFTTKDKIFNVYVAIFVSFVLVSLFMIARFIFGPDFLSFGIFTETTSNTVGKWNDLGIFFGLIAILSLITLEFFALGRFVKVLAYIALFLSMFFLALINFGAVWIVLGLFSVILFVYLFSFSKKKSYSEESDEESPTPRRRFPLATLVAVVISVVFVLFGGYLSNKLATKFQISQLEVRPSWQSTFSVAKGTFGGDPIFGAGPNRFVSEWLKYKDPAVNSTMFWSSDFNYGVGLLPTFIVTTGILGTLAWLIFLAAFLYIGFKAMFQPTVDKTKRYLTMLSFFGALFLWLFNIIYAPSNAIVALSFIITGLFLASLVQEGLVRIKRGSYTINSKLSFVSVLCLIFLLVVSVSCEYSILQRYIAQTYFQKGLNAFNISGNVDLAEKRIVKAASVSRNDLFYRALVEIGINKIVALVNTPESSVPAEELRTRFQNILGSTLNYAEEATKIDSTNYENWISRGRIYEAIVPLKIEGAYEAAKSAYEQALTRNIHSPAIYLMMARLEFAKEDNAKTREYITKALQKKNNYIEAIYLLTQVAVKEGNLKEAISTQEAASVLSPNDPAVLFQLGLLRYMNKEYKSAIATLEQTLTLSPVYANAKYYLGLAYDKIGNEKGAIQQFTDLKETNPDNKEIDKILANLKAGRAALSQVGTGEKSGALPVKEKSSKTKSPPASTEEEEEMSL